MEPAVLSLQGPQSKHILDEWCACQVQTVAPWEESEHRASSLSVSLNLRLCSESHRERMSHHEPGTAWLQA